MRGGYLPKITGRPVSDVRDVPVPAELGIDLRQGDLVYALAVKDGDTVRFGDSLAWAETAGGRIALPAPAAGRVAVENGERGEAQRLRITVSDATAAPVAATYQPDRVSAEVLRNALAAGGIWPLIWSSATKGMPMLDGSEEPRRIVVNCVAAEPFRTRGKVVLEECREQVAAGLRYLQRLLAEYGTIHLVLTHLSDPVAKAIRAEVAGQAWVRVESVPVTYPIENPQVLRRALCGSSNRATLQETIWVLDIQAAASVGACLANGLPLFERIVAVGGPGAEDASHRRVRVGTPLDGLLGAPAFAPERCVLRGGLFTGEAEKATTPVAYADDAFFVLPRPQKREFLGFVTPGFDRRSILRCFASQLTGAPDRHITTALRGERRPCIACGLCESVCPVDLLPQVLHRYLYRDALDEAEATGLTRCIGCGLCSYVCPSKLDLVHQFEEARARIEAEHKEAAAAEAERARREETKRQEKEHSEDWRK